MFFRAVEDRQSKGRGLSARVVEMLVQLKTRSCKDAALPKPLDRLAPPNDERTEPGLVSMPQLTVILTIRSRFLRIKFLQHESRKIELGKRKAETESTKDNRMLAYFPYFCLPDS